MASSISSSNPTPPPIANQTVQAEDKFTLFIERRLRLTGNHVKLVDLFGGLMMLCGFVLASLLLLCVVDAWVFELSAALRIIALLSILALSGGYFVIKLLPLLIKRINPAYAAKMIEDGHPEFKNSLLNHVFFKRDPRGAKPLVTSAVHRKAAEDISRITIETAVDRGFLIRAAYFFAAVFAVFGLYKVLSPKDPFTTVARIAAPFAEISRPSRVQIDDIEPGDVEIFFGEKLTVEARISGVGDGELVNLVFSSEDGQIVDRHILMKSDDDKKNYSSNLSSSDSGVQQNLTYWIKAGDGESRRFKVIVKPRPSFVVQSVKIAPPVYTKLESFELQQGNLASVEGAAVTVHALANLPIDVAFIQLLALPESDGQLSADSATATPAVEPKFVESISMQVTNETEAVGKFWLQMQSDRLIPRYTHYRVGFLTKDGIGNENATVYRLQTTPDLKPETELVQPRETISRLPENRKTRIQVQAFDPDYQLTDIRLVGDRRGSHLFEKSILQQNSQSDGQIDVVYQFDPRGFGLRSGDEVLIHALALDNRHAPISDVIDPNSTKSKQIRIQITPAVEEPAGSDTSATDDNQQANPKNQDQNQRDTPNPRENQQTKSDRNDDSKADGNDQKQDGGSSEDSGESDGNSKENSKKETQQKNDQSKSGDSKKQESGGSGSQSDNSQQDSSQSKSDGSESGSQSSGDQSQKGNQPNQGTGDSKSNQSDSSQNAGQNDGNSSNSSPDGNDSSRSKPNSGQPNQQNVDQQRQDAAENGATNSSEPVDHPGEAFDRIKKHVEQTKKSDQQSQDSQDQKSDAADADNEQQKSGTQPVEATEGSSQQKPEGGKQDESRKDDSQQNGSSKENTNAKENGSKQDGTKQSSSKQSDAKQDDSKQTGSKQDSSESNPGGAKQNDSKGKGRDDNQPNETGVDDNGQKKEGSDQEGAKEGGSKKEGADNEGAEKGGDAKSDSEKSGDKKDAAGKDGDDQGAAPRKTGKQESGEGAGDEKAGDESSKEDRSQGTEDKNSGKKGTDQTEGDDQAKTGSDQAKSGKSDASQHGGKKQPESADQTSDSAEKGGDSTNEKSRQQKSDDSNRDSKSTDGAAKPGGGNGDRQRSDSDANNAADESPDGDAANLEYARKATDLVLDYLKDHQDDADNELLDELNWSPEEMRDFYEKWEQMRKQAEQGGAAERKRYEEALRSLGLRPGREGVEGENIRQQKIEGLLEKGNRSQPPAHLLEEFRSFNKGRSRANNR